MPAPRIASLLPSATEIVSALGMGPHLVGVSHECDHPAEVVGLPVLTSSAVRPCASSADIDRGVREILRDALAVYDIDLDALAAARPDVIVTQDLCEVCAVSRLDVERAVEELAGSADSLGEVRIVNLHPTRLEDIRDDIARVAEALDCTEAGAACQAEMDGRIEAVRRRAGALERPAVLCIEWIDPVMIGGTWMPELVTLAGGEPLVGRPGENAPTLSIEELAGLDPAPDVVLIKPCGFDIERTLAEREVLQALLYTTGWPAAGSGSVWVADGNAFFNRPGPRIADSLEILAACVHPDAFEDLAEKHAGSFLRL